MPRKGRHRCWPSPASPRFNEAGAVMPRKERVDVAGLRIVHQASMRPGLLCPGKPAPRCRDTSGLVRFNEAGAVMPRKGGAGQHWPGAADGFNEAGAVMPRKAALPNPSPAKANFTSFRAPLPFAHISGGEGGCRFLHHVKAQQYQYLTRIREPFGSCAPRNRSQPVRQNQADSMIIPRPHAFRYRKKSCRCSRSPISSSPPARCRSAERDPRPL